MASNGVFKFSVASHEAGLRLDTLMADHLPECSRSYAALLIRQGHVHVDGCNQKPSYKVKFNQVIESTLPEPKSVDLIAQPIALDILFEDSQLIVVNKPPAMVVHPAAGHSSGTLVNALLHHCPDLTGIGGERRPGIVHRLDKDTSGVMVVAKTARAHHELSKQFKARTIEKQYQTLVQGIPEDDSGCIELPVGRHPADRKKMSTVSRSGRKACTLWRVAEKFRGSALLEIDLKTGRTHQIRVHCRAIGHPVVGDPVYGWPKALQRLFKIDPGLYKVFRLARRQMLHALQLAFDHPVTGKRLTFQAPVAEDMELVLNKLRGII